MTDDDQAAFLSAIQELNRYNALLKMVIEAGPGAVFFAEVMIITIFAAMSFDPRLIWDTEEV